MSTLEHRLKFESGLPIGLSLVYLTHKGHKLKTLVNIGKRGKVSILTQPKPDMMHSSWDRVKGDSLFSEGTTIVWGARDKSLMDIFNPEPLVSVEVSSHE